jgi:glycerol-3-phosphate acyltransferase PlsY
MIYLLFALIGYFIGSIPFSYLIPKVFKGVDIRKLGDRNVGGSNVMRSVGLPYGILSGLLDFSKAMLPPLIARSFGLSLGVQVIGGFFAIVGHNWSLYLGFRGGRGVGSSLGLLLLFVPKELVLSFILAALFALISEGALGVLMAFTLLTFWTLLKNPEYTLKILVVAVYLLLIFRRLSFLPGDIKRGLPPLKTFLVRLLFDTDRKRKLKPVWKK